MKKTITNYELRITNLNLKSKIFLFCLLSAVCCLLPSQVVAETREFELTVTDGEVELNGTKFMVWKYNDTFPGPEIRVKEGDVVKVKLMNKSSAKHGLFFHGLHVNPRVSLQEQEIIVDPGYEYTYGEFVAGPPGTHLYHCSYNMAEHLSRGLYGAFIVEAKDEPKYDKEYVYIFSDWNSKSAKGEGSHELGHPMTIMDNDITTINNRVVKGDNPIILDIKKGERVRLRFANIGHLPHKLKFSKTFLVTHEDGYPAPNPQKQDSLTIYSGKRFDLIVTIDKTGKYIFSHSITMPESAAQKLAEPDSGKHAAHNNHTANTKHSNNIIKSKEVPVVVIDVRK
ncbi:MAG: multicopper oxidase domain-containing protein [Deltaproteobacteria bacterium]|nr:multicopper oxidase domain-containing protein [Deltaproteobacteria bacterium]